MVTLGYGIRMLLDQTTRFSPSQSGGSGESNLAKYIPLNNIIVIVTVTTKYPSRYRERQSSHRTSRISSLRSMTIILSELFQNDGIFETQECGCVIPILHIYNSTPH